MSIQKIPNNEYYINHYPNTFNFLRSHDDLIEMSEYIAYPLYSYRLKEYQKGVLGAFIYEASKLLGCPSNVSYGAIVVFHSNISTSSISNIDDLVVAVLYTLNNFGDLDYLSELNVEARFSSKVKIETNKITIDDLVGLSTLKKQVQDYEALARVSKKRQKLGNESSFTLHSVFLGNPGTGKTTVARIFAEKLYSIGLLSKGHLVEIDRSGLVAEYVGQTEKKTAEVIDSSIGGVLFIDEAYGLIVNKSGNDYGKQAIEILLKKMEDYRDDLVVIIAGYENEMENFLDSNPGLESRFAHKFHFEDYNTNELVELFHLIAKQEGFNIEESSDQQLQKVFNAVKVFYNKSSKVFPNGRFVRNFFDRVKINHALRIESIEDEKIDETILNEISWMDVRGASKYFFWKWDMKL